MIVGTLIAYEEKHIEEDHQSSCTMVASCHGLGRGLLVTEIYGTTVTNRCKKTILN